MKTLSIKSILFTLALLLFYPFISSATANTGEQGSSNGQPFKTLQSHIDLLETDFNAAIANLQNQIDTAAQNFQDQIDDLVASQAAQDNLIATLNTAVSLLKTRVTANESDITALQAVDNFQTQLIQLLTSRLATLENRVTANENDIAAIILADQTTQALILALQNQINTLSLRISANDGDISILQSQVQSLNTSLVNLQTQLAQKQDRVDGVCPANYSIRVINADGSVICEYDSVSSGVGTFQRLTVNAEGEIPPAGLVVGYLSQSATCPSTYSVTGGGYEFIPIEIGLRADPRLVKVVSTYSSSNSSWNVQAINDNLSLFGCCRIKLKVYASCGRVR